MHTNLLSDRISVVTGASAGIGAAIVRALVDNGAAVVANARRADKLDAMVKAWGPRTAAAAGDCADHAVIAKMLDAAKAGFGGGARDADLIVVNAGRGLNGSVMTSDQSQWEEMIRTNLLGAAALIRAAGERMLRTNEGKTGPAVLDRPRDIVVIGSTVGRHVSPFSSMYGATKFGLHGLVEGARRELGPKGIRVTLIEPGFVESEFQGVAGYDPKWVAEVFARIGPVLGPDDVARLVTFVASQPAFVHVSDLLIRPTRQDYP
ncbi:MAG: SDR family oxidoreductase [Phycisphaerales bacterium]